MSLIFKHESGGEIHQIGLSEAPLCPQAHGIGMMILAANGLQSVVFAGNVSVVAVPLEDFYHWADVQAAIWKAAGEAAAHGVEAVKKGERVAVMCARA